MKPWPPTTFIRFGKCLGTSTNAAIVETDAGTAYLKALGNPEGPHALASDWVGTRLARLFGLPTFEYAILQIDADVDEIPLANGRYAESGSAFCTREEPGHTWGGEAAELQRLVNSHDIPRLVVFDTWIRNRDRHFPDYSVRKPNRDNVFLSTRDTPSGSYRLLAIDHTHCFSHRGELTKRLKDIGSVKDNRIYGLFPEFARYFNPGILSTCVQGLQALDTNQITGIVGSIPFDWEVDATTRAALVELLADRADYLAQTLPARLQQQEDTWAFL